MNASFIRVKAVKLNSGHWQYIGVAADGTEHLLRKAATRLYANAFEHDRPVATGSNGKAAYFTYGQNNGRYSKAVIAVYPITAIEHK